MGWDDIQDMRDSSMMRSGVGERGGSTPESFRTSKTKGNRTRVWMYVLSFLVVVLLVLTCTVLAVSVNDDKETQEALAILDEHSQAFHRHDDPLDDKDDGDSSRMPPTSAPVPTASPSVPMFPSMSPSAEETSVPTGPPTASPFASYAPFGGTASPSALTTGETIQPVVSPTATSVATGETTQPVVSPTATSMVTGEIIQPVMSPTVSPVAIGEISQPVMSPTVSPVATVETSQPVASPTASLVPTGYTSQPVASAIESPVATGQTSQPVVPPTEIPLTTGESTQPVALSPGLLRMGPVATAEPVASPMESPAAGNESWLQVGQELIWNQVSAEGVVSLSRDGTTVAIGHFVSRRVDVYRYDNNMGQWKPLGRTIRSETLAGRFGYSVALNEDGTVLAIGDADDGSESTGRVLVFEFLDDDWVQLGVDIEDKATDRYSGNSVALSNDGLVRALDVQITSRTPGSPNFVRVYRYNGDTWNQIGQDVFAEQATLSDTFSLSLSGNGMIFAISSAVPGFGYLKTYKLNDQGTWDLQGEIFPSSSGEEIFESIGLAVSLSGNGAFLATGVRSFKESNLVRCFQFTNGTWSQLGSDIDTEGADPARRITLSMSTDGKTVAIGPQDGTPYARVHAFDVLKKSWRQMGDNIKADPLKSSGYQLQSISLSGSGSRVAVYDSLVDHINVYDDQSKARRG